MSSFASSEFCLICSSISKRPLNIPDQALSCSAISLVVWLILWLISLVLAFSIASSRLISLIFCSCFPFSFIIFSRSSLCFSCLFVYVLLAPGLILSNLACAPSLVDKVSKSSSLNPAAFNSFFIESSDCVFSVLAFFNSSFNSVALSLDFVSSSWKSESFFVKSSISFPLSLKIVPCSKDNFITFLIFSSILAVRSRISLYFSGVGALLKSSVFSIRVAISLLISLILLIVSWLTPTFKSTPFSAISLTNTILFTKLATSLLTSLNPDCWNFNS